MIETQANCSIERVALTQYDKTFSTGNLIDRIKSPGQGGVIQTPEALHRLKS